MRPLLLAGLLLVAILAIGRSDASAQSLTLDFQQTVTLRVAGATAAFSLDPALVGAAASAGEVTLVGRAPGTTHVIIVVGDRNESIEVVVREPATFTLPGFTASGGSEFEGGTVDVRYGSNPGLVQSGFRFERRLGDRSVEVALSGAVPFGDDELAPLSLPLVSYRVRGPRRDVALGDLVVNHSPLTASRSSIRGVHWREGPVVVHAGYSFFGNFENLLLPTDREVVGGVGYRHRLGPRSSLTSNLFYIGTDRDDGRSGPVGTVLYETGIGADVRTVAEVGWGQTFAAAGEVQFERTRQRGWMRARHAPRSFPALATEQPGGTLFEGSWWQQWQRFNLGAFASSNRYDQPSSAQTSRVARVDLNYQLSDRWRIYGGSGYSLFDNSRTDRERFDSLTLPAGVALSLPHFGAGVDYEWSRETTRNLGGHLARVSLNASAGGFFASASAERQTQAPTVGFVYSEAPWLREVLDRQGVTAGTPAQLSELLQTSAALSALGYRSDVVINLTPARTRLTANATWTGEGRAQPRLSLGTVVNHDELVDRTRTQAVHSLTFSRRVTGAMEVFLAGSVLCTATAKADSCDPVFSVALQRRLSRAPALFVAPVAGQITGRVFRDDQRTGVYVEGMAPMPAVEVILDGTRRTWTDAQGRFRFGSVGGGRHRVAIVSPPGPNVFFTTPSPAEVGPDAAVDFGVAFAGARLRGVVVTDAGAPLGGLTVAAEAAGRRVTAQTGGDGAYGFDGLPSGVCEVKVEASSVPPGYAIDDLRPQQVELDAGVPARASFSVRAHRSVAGEVRVFDRRVGAYVAVPGAQVELQPLGLSSTTDDRGRFVFRDLPAGTFQLSVARDGLTASSSVKVEEQPVALRGTNLLLVPTSGAETVPPQPPGVPDPRPR